jgi:cytochrome c
MSVEVYGLWIIVLVLLAIVSLYLFAILRTGNTRYGTHVFAVFLLAVLGLVAGDQLATENATREHTFHLLEKAEAVRSEREEARRIVMAKSSLSPEEGKKLYEAKCTACHKFDEKLVGPPHRAVLPKYKSDIDGLVAYLRNPTKVDPDYPPMPNLGLSPSEARAIAEYLFEEVILED